MSASSVTIAGVKDVQKILKSMDKKHARRIARNTVRGIASRAAKMMKSEAPTETRNLRTAIKAKTQKSSPDNPQAKVEIKKGKVGAAFYWHMVDRGTAKIRADGFVTDTIDQITQELPSIVRQEFVKKVEKAVEKELKDQAKRVK